MTSEHILAIDQGTTSTRAMIFSLTGECPIVAQQELPQIYPADGWVEHDPEEIWRAVVTVCRQALAEAKAKGLRVAGIGITNQRETTVVWNRSTSQPIYNAIVWQDRRTAVICDTLRDAGTEESITAATGLLIDPYFSASKLCWILDQIPGARAQAEAGELAFGTIDSFLLWRLTGGQVHATDVTNACRTMLFNIHSQQWDPQMLEIFRVPPAVLPEVRDCSDDFGTTSPDLFDPALPIRGIAGDQQAAAIGQGCIEAGMIKSTYGTGCFVLLNTGSTPCRSNHRLLTTIAYRVQGQTGYALEGSIFVAGAAIQWIRDGIRLIGSSAEVERLAQGLDSNRGVYMVPAFTGLGAPHWDPHARGAIFGLTRDTGIAEIARAALESVGYQTYDLMDAIQRDYSTDSWTLRVDGGMAANNWFLQFLADLLAIPVERPRVTETTALGAAWLAAIQLGLLPSLAVAGEYWQREARFIPQCAEQKRQEMLAGWQQAVARVLTRTDK
ncbi:glycerol kinase GlpK [Desulfobulbus alkaliphilus]|uniref:glycerol kinase GlpK n=1 Tax=Desulfobulbus alkaliphilus TaxID=869814 RepID=UPI0019647213|nr:glycerol kinase GlpK [Desulfobulbus alkaliphilus]MBM9537467.1 glycerol kinase GlpK [Desulfobulbus alkaliphilus]